ncbi:MAG: ABC transporter permease subunit [Treponema sp.]|jgi:NitT/TauT family transport system permease protein|nr:ABC transporter permease subunit [Treponema sp.]
MARVTEGGVGLRKLLPVVSLVFAVIIQIIVENAQKHPAVKTPYFTYALFAGLGVYAVFLTASFFNKNIDTKIKYKSYFIAAAVLFLNVLNILTGKFAILPVLFFPSLDKVFGVFVNESMLLLKCLGYSLRLLGCGYVFGALAGLTTGICIGFSKRVSYWISPVIRVLGPIPSTAWIPLVLVSFPSAVSASSFLIALSVWFPTTIMTSSGISNINNSYFEVSATLGADNFSKIFRVGVPAAMPHIFLGLFNGTCASFITLITAEMIGAKYGIGWYINWQKDMLSYANVYAGLIIIAVVFSILVTFLFKLRDKLLLWQKGVIKW